MRAIIVDDERLARKELCRLLKAHPDVEIAGEAIDVEAAVQQVRDREPDLLFLDIHLPGGSGFDVLDKLDTAPPVIFTTAYDTYAVRAFEVNALDYLMKPIIPERLAAALDKTRRERNRLKPDTPLPQVFVRDGERCWLVRTDHISLFESEGNYTRLYFDAERPLILRSLQTLEQRLDPSMFFRGSRKHILNLAHVESVDVDVAGNYVVRLRGGFTIGMSRRQSIRLRETLSL
ncbi:MAG TPA: LytTR family DNA-binding domain-containing protein [Bryobacteraceae bacterium]|nr:LytTR family DNA-binding domain-containing protein [Bryobacteraceae bacterium]